jgi:hypothetical protein
MKRGQSNGSLKKRRNPTVFAVDSFGGVAQLSTLGHSTTHMTSEHFQNGLTAYQKLFWPDFVEHDDCVFVAFDEPIYKQWLQQTGGDKRKVEAVMNHRHIIDILPETVESPTRSLVVSFGQLLRDVWDAKLRRDFPTSIFVSAFHRSHAMIYLIMRLHFTKWSNTALEPISTIRDTTTQ